MERGDHLWTRILIDSPLNDVVRDDQKPPMEDGFSNGLELRERLASGSSLLQESLSMSKIFKGKIQNVGTMTLSARRKRPSKCSTSTSREMSWSPMETVHAGKSEDADLPLNTQISLMYWVLENPIPSVKATCDQHGTKRRKDMSREEREATMQKMRARGLDIGGSEMSPEDKGTAEKMDLKPINAAEDPISSMHTIQCMAARWCLI